jgi:hydrogenase expression/formation protein HypC
MCVAIPSRVVECNDSTATVERFGERIVVSLLMLSEPVELGDYLIIQAQSFAVEKIGREQAEESLALFRECLGLSDDEEGYEEGDGEAPVAPAELRGEGRGR